MADREILPDTFRPQHYDLFISDLHLSAWTYRGNVVISGELIRPTTEITLNTLDLELQSAKVEIEHMKATYNQAATDFSYDERKQRCTIQFKDELPASAKVKLTIIFTGNINHDMAGFYRSQYKPAAPAAVSVPRDSEFHYMLSTQFESCDARRAFPCFDEPNLKATFDFSIAVPDDQVALSNMPVKETKQLRPGTVVASFERTPVMSTYLLAWAVGDFEHIEAFTERRYDGKQIPVRVYTTRGLIEQGRWALQHAPKIIDFFSEKFGVDYPLPKADILAAHEFTHGAMENWGLVTYRTTALLFDEKLSDVRFRQRVAYVVAHELAHQWFGNSTTMSWWDELWLNEGFATWAGWLAVDYLHPDWQVWPQFVTGDMKTAFQLDSIRASHPIQVPVRDALDVNQIFDHISYLKGCSVIKMLASHLSVETFLKGVSLYLKKHSFANAKTEDLWSALSEASGLDINELMDPWIRKIGFPVVTVSEGDGSVTLKQSRFLSTGDVKTEDDTTTWWVPLALSGTKGADAENVNSLTSKEAKLNGVGDDFYLVNTNADGFYLVNYPPERLALLGKQLDRLSSSDKVFIASSASQLAFSGFSSTPALLSFLRGFSGETDYLVLSQALDTLGTLKSVFGDDTTILNGLRTFTLRLIDTALDKVSWEVPPNDDFTNSMLRKKLLLSAVTNGHQKIKAEALERFTAYFEKGDKTAIHPDLRAAVYRAAVQANPAGAAVTLKGEWNATKAVEGKEVCLVALGHVTDPDTIRDVIMPFNMAMSPPAPASESVPPADVHILYRTLSRNRKARPILWDYIRAHWDDAIVKKLGGNPILLDRVVKVSLGSFVDVGAVAEIDAFFADKDTAAFSRTLETVKDQVRGRAAYRTRDSDALRAWLGENGYC